MPYDPIRDSSSGSSNLSPLLPNGTTPVVSNRQESPSTRRSSSDSGPLITPGESLLPAYASSSSTEAATWSPVSNGAGGGAPVAPPPPSRRLSLSMLLNDNQAEADRIYMEQAGRRPSDSRSNSFSHQPPLQSASSSTRTSPAVHQPPLPSTVSFPPPPALRRTSYSSSTSYESYQPIHSPSIAPPGFTDAHSMPTPNADTPFVMDAVPKRGSLSVEGTSGGRRKSSTSSLASKTSSGRHGSFGDAGSSGLSSESRRKASDSSTTSASSASVLQPAHPPPPSHLTQTPSSRSNTLSSGFPPPPSPHLASISPRNRQPSLPTPPSSLPPPPSHLPSRPSAISPTTTNFPPPSSHRESYSNQPSLPRISPTASPPLITDPPSSMVPPSSDPSAPNETAYAPRNRTSAPRSVLVPLTWEEYTRLREHPEEGSKNPMRGQGPKPKSSLVAKVEQQRSSGVVTAGMNGSYFPQGASRPSSSAGAATNGVDRGEEDSGRLVSPTRVPQKRSGEFENGDAGGQRRRVDGAGGYVNADVAKVASHYNARPEVGVESRQLSPIIGLKSFNNWVKSVLIGKFTRPGFPQPNRRDKPQGVVLDLGCGKGGDLQKWNVARIQHYMGFDIADVSVSQARERAQNLRSPSFSFEFYQLDCFAEPISKIIPEQRLLQYPIDAVTMQFCMHYAFETEEKARMMLDNVSRYLRPGGSFMGTIPNAEILLSNLDKVPDDAERFAFGNDVYEIAFDDKVDFPMYGHRYSFFLHDAVEDVPEYIVHWDNFEALAAEYGLHLIYKKEFHEVYEEERELPDFGPLLQKMRVVNDQGDSEMTADQYEAANLYLAFAFQKH